MACRFAANSAAGRADAGRGCGAKAEIYRHLRQLARDGMATLVISSDLPELLLLCDRILVMREGRIAGELSRSEATEENILALALPSRNEAGKNNASENQADEPEKIG